MQKGCRKKGERCVDQTAVAAQAEMHRALLTGVACPKPGTVAAAEDLIQAAHVPFARAAWSEPRDVPACLTMSAGRLCVDELGSARARGESYAGPGPGGVGADAGRKACASPAGLGPGTGATPESGRQAPRHARPAARDQARPPGLRGRGAVSGITGFPVARSRITEIDFVINPEKLKRATYRLRAA
jgi:hypothetical protein